MTSRLLAILFCLLLAPAAFAGDPQNIKILYVDREGDPFYAPRESYGGIYDATRQSAAAGAELGVKDAKVIGRATNTTFELDHQTVREGATFPEDLAERVGRVRPSAIILDVPADDLIAAAKALAPTGLPLFNIRERGDDVRRKTCNSNLFHVIPSDSMFQDAIAQYLKLMRWNDVLVVASDAPRDQVLAQAFERSADKFGVTISGQRTFVPGNDPRQREQNNVRLLTGDVDYDAVYVADTGGDFGPGLQFKTVLPRPVIGGAGLRSVAWHPYWERNGAPQLNRRFFKATKRQMTEEDWAAWVAVKAVVEAAVQSKGDGGALIDQLLKGDFTLELYKGFPGSFRTWDHQLRQAILLAGTDAVIGLAPVEGALHEFNTLDTLGFDKPEFRCEP